ncbi:hypothetical protein FH972_000632 [Carpinus fangiana]|uniref:Uncharacterized protein n=1 Tax=Carpinus fangiana TaxID=176857 RepID=A0A5N6QB51_9ROSI|nr:hypothetical protein FH972_000632 [Carpinus fangiana]
MKLLHLQSINEASAPPSTESTTIANPSSPPSTAILHSDHDLEPTHSESDPKIQLQSNTENPIGLIRIEVGDLGGVQQEQLLPFKDGAENGRVHVPLVKRRWSLGVESLALVVSVGLDAVVVDADALVGDPDGDVEGKVVVELVVGSG